MVASQTPEPLAAAEGRLGVPELPQGAFEGRGRGPRPALEVVEHPHLRPPHVTGTRGPETPIGLGWGGVAARKRRSALCGFGHLMLKCFTHIHFVDLYATGVMQGRKSAPEAQRTLRRQP